MPQKGTRGVAKSVDPIGLLLKVQSDLGMYYLIRSIMLCVLKSKYHLGIPSHCV